MPSRTRASLRALLVPALGAWLIVCAPSARAAWPPDPTVNVPLCTTAFSSRITRAVPDGRGGAIAVWWEDRSGDFDVFARRVDSTGVAQWAANGVPVCVTTPGTSQVLPKAVPDGVKGTIVVWIDSRLGANALFAQRVDSSGTRRWGDAGVLLASTKSSQVTEFDVAADGAGGIAVAWATPVSGISSDIYAQRLNAAGALLWGTNAKALCTINTDQAHPQIVCKASGKFVVAWEDQRNAFRTDIYGQSLDAAGTLLWALNGIPLANAADSDINPLLVASGADDCILAWDADSLGVGDIRAQHLTATGAAAWPAAGQHMFPEGVSGLLAVAPDNAGGMYLVTSVPEAVSGKTSLWLQRVRATGSPVYVLAGRRVSSVPSNQTQVVVAPDNAGGLLLTWLDDQRNLPKLDVLAQRMDLAGNPQWALAGVPVCRAGNTGPGLCIAPSGNGAVIAWSDTRTTTSPDIYAQGVDALGQLAAPALAVDPPVLRPESLLAAPSPNPAARSASITYTLPGVGRVLLSVVDPTGRLVAVLDAGVRYAGRHMVTWDAQASGRRLPPGVYLVQLTTEAGTESRRLVLL
jgi:hypothetical protein